MADCPKRPINLSHTPSWFKETPGFRFRDPDKDLVMVIGEGGWRETHPAKLYVKPIKMGVADEKFEDLGPPSVFTLEMKPWTLLGVYNYKGEWHFIDLAAQPTEWWEKSKPL